MKQICNGADATCYLLVNGSVFCSGYNSERRSNTRYRHRDRETRDSETRDSVTERLTLRDVQRDGFFEVMNGRERKEWGRDDW